MFCIHITFTILDFLHSIETPFRFSSSFFFSSCACICASMFLLICILFLFNTDVNWLPGSASPHGYSRQLVLNFTINNFIEYCNFLFKARMNVSKNKINKDWLYDENDLHSELLSYFKLAKLKHTTNNRLTQRSLWARPSEVKLDVQLVIFTLDINALSVQT